MNAHEPAMAPPPRLDPRKFRDPAVTADGSARAVVPFAGLQTLWINTGTLCNVTCARCYIESSPTNDALVYITAAEAARFLDEAAVAAPGLREVGFTGGEPFMNPDILALLDDALSRGYRALTLTNAMRPMMRPRLRKGLLALKARFGAALTLRVSLDHHSATLHEAERGAGTWAIALAGLRWLGENGFRVDVAGRLSWGEDEATARAGYARLLGGLGVDIDADDPARLVLFPEMDASADTPEITEACWGILNRRPDSVMCATSRMVVKRKGAARPTVIACTLLPYDPAFELGETLSAAARPVALNHSHCSRFCVLGGASCSAG